MASQISHRAMSILATVGCALLGAVVAEPAASVECSLIQLSHTREGDFDNPSLTADGVWLAYDREVDGNVDVYVTDLRDLTTTRITDRDGIDTAPDVGESGPSVAFVSNGDYTGSNPDQTFEVFLYDLSTDLLTQVTDFALLRSIHSLQLTEDASAVFFFSSDDLTGENPDGTNEIFRFDRIENELTQLTLTDFSERLAGGFGIDGTGSRATFASYGDFAGLNSDGNREIFIVRTDTQQFSQVTRTVHPGSSLDPLLNRDGTAMVFFSSAEELLGDNPDRATEVVALGASRHRFRVLSDDAPWLINARISGDGNRVVASLNDEIRLYDLPSGEVVTVMEPPQFWSGVQVKAVNHDGALIVILTREDPLGENPDGNYELFLSRCSDSRLPTLALTGACPGEVTAVVENATPYSVIDLVWSMDLGTDPLPAGACAGTPTGLSEPVLLVRGEADNWGRLTKSRAFGAEHCGMLVQSVDLISCELSSVHGTP